MTSLIFYGFTAGAVATVNPCGFALLPAWFAREIAANGDQPLAVRVMRAVLAGGAVSLGFVAVFIIAGLIFAVGAAWLGRVLPWVGVALGFALAAIGMVWLTGLRLPGGGFAASCRRANARYGAFGFGLSYGLVSISCTLPVFTAVAGMSFLADDAISPAGIVAFLAGAASVLMLVAVAGASSGAALAALVESRAQILRRLAGGLTLLAGLYIALYWGRLFLANTPLADEIAFAVGAWASRAATLLSSRAGVAVLLIGATALAGLAWVLTIVTGRQRRLSRQNEHTLNWNASGEHRHDP